MHINYILLFVIVFIFSIKYNNKENFSTSSLGALTQLKFKNELDTYLIGNAEDYIPKILENNVIKKNGQNIHFSLLINIINYIIVL